MTFDHYVLLEKEERLQLAKQALNSHFVGLESIIDAFIQLIRPWYLTPTLLDRPTIVNMWGMTGVGKTDLIRRFVKLIDFQDRFLEIELSNSHRSAYFEFENSVSGILHRNKLFDNQPSILFFDEIQHFRSIDQEGKEVFDRRFQDFWELLSDRKLSRRDVVGELDELMLEMAYEEARNKPYNDAKSKTGDVDAQDLLQSPWIVKRLKKIFSASENQFSSEALSSMSTEQILALLRSTIESKKIFETADLRQSLIIVGGNLDSLYTMSGLSSEAEIDATIFYEQTRRLHIVDVKRSLEERFRPEQISRLGNSHIIYPSLRADDYRELIKRRLKSLEVQIRDETSMSLWFDDSIEHLIYRNGVFPTQGVRPVFSAISEILISRLSEWILLSVQKNQSRLKISYHSESSAFELFFPDGDEDSILLPFSGVLDLVREGKTQNEQALVATHEAGHAVLYAILFGLAPVQLKSRLASSDKNGFTFPHKIQFSRTNLILQIKVLVAGFLAEELLFGKELVSTGHQADIEKATSLASSVIRELNFGPKNGKIVSPYDRAASAYKTDIEASNTHIDQLLKLATGH